MIFLFLSLDVCKLMDCKCAITVSTLVINLFLKRHSADYVPLTDDLRIQVLPSVALLSSGQKHHFGAFIKDQRRLIVWDDDPKRALERAEYIVDSLVQMIWNQTEPAFDTNKQDANPRSRYRVSHLNRLSLDILRHRR